MSIIKAAIDGKATRHETGGGTCKTITVGGIQIKVCLDENGIIIDEQLRQLAKITGQ